MKQTILLVLTAVFLSCNQSSRNEKLLNDRIDSLEKKVSDTYKPGLGEFMSNIQSHHAKLWFAGLNQNWKLCDFELHEIIEAFSDVQKYQTERKELQIVGMINPPLDSMKNAIQHKDPLLFKNSYTLLTNICNNCHNAVQFEFNVVKIPDIQMFSNQDFKVRKK